MPWRRRWPPLALAATALALCGASGIELPQEVPEDQVLTADDSSCDLSTEEWLPLRGLRGECPTALENGTKCEPRCTDGYNMTGEVWCWDGGEIKSTLRCEPMACYAHDALGDFGPGDCPRLLPSGAHCSPACGTNYSLAANMSCAYGNLTPFECELLFLPCQPGHEQRGRVCEPCLRGSFKSGIGPGPCTFCPDGLDPWAPLAQSSSAAACICNSTNWANRTSDGEVLACIPCPPNSQIRVGIVGTRVEDCVCKPDFRRVPPQEDLPMERCRPPDPCAVGEFLQRNNLTGSEAHKLQLGSCGRFVYRPPGANWSEVFDTNDTEDEANNDTDRDGWMPHLADCKLACRPGTSAQVHSDFFRAVDLNVRCDDGRTEGPMPFTWCSEASFTIPPLIFLAMVTLAAMTAGFRMERRQVLFERQVLEALEIRRAPELTAAPAAPVASGARGKCKMA